MNTRVLVPLAKKYGFCETYFTMMKHTNLTKLKYIFSFDKDNEKSLRKYVEHINSLLEKMALILFDFESNKADYGRLLCSLNLSKSKYPTMIYENDALSVFRARDTKTIFSYTFEKIQKWETIIKALDE